MQEGLKTAVSDSDCQYKFVTFDVQIKVPQSLADRTNQVWESLLELAECGNVNCKSDLQVLLAH